MIQTIVVGIVFVGATMYLARSIYRQFTSGTSCETGCGKCSAVDFKKIEKHLAEKGSS